MNEARVTTPFPLIRQHVLLLRSGDLDAAAARAVHLVTDEVIDAVLAAIPDDLLMDPVTGDDSPDATAARARYSTYLRGRRAASPAFTAAAIEARDALRASPAQPYQARR